jgi:small-conductance mechanosensitive channel
MSPRRYVLSMIVLLVSLAGRAWADEPTTTTTAPSTIPSTEPTTAPATQPAPPPRRVTAALSNVADELQQTTSLLKLVDAHVAGDRVVSNIEQDLADLTTEIAARLHEGPNVAAAAQSLEDLRTQEHDLGEIRGQLSNWTDALHTRTRPLVNDEKELDAAASAWRQKMRAIEDATVTVDPDVAARVEALIRQTQDAQSRVTSRLAYLRALVSRVAAQDVRVAEAQAAVRDAQTIAVNRLLERDSEPVWTGRLGPEAQQNLAQDSRNSFARQWAATWAYANRFPMRFVGHAALIVGLSLIGRRIRIRWGAKIEAEPSTARSASVFRRPIPAAIVATLPLIPWLYPQAPRLLLALLGGAMLAPAILVLRRLVVPALRPLLYALAVFYVLGLTVSVTASLPALSRTLFLVAMVGGVVLLARFLHRVPRDPEYAAFATTRHWQVVHFGVRLALVLMAASAISNALGFVSLARLLGDGVLTAAYVAIMLDACVRVVHALLAVLLHVEPVAELRVIRNNGPRLLRGATIVIGLAAFAWWLVITLDAFSIRRPVLNRLDAILNTRWGVGAVDLSLGGILAFAAAVTASFLVSRFVRFVLAEDVYPRVQLPRGTPYAISTLLHYSILFVGFLIAVAALGYDMTKFTILAGAFGVGLGFGMQNIVNNFVSGLILLFERPIQVGDVIELDADTIGTVSRIGIRASVIRKGSAAEVIVPNGILIAGRVTNWTLSNRQRGFTVPVSIAGGTEPATVIERLTRAARETDCVAARPAPEAYLTEFLPGGGLKFELQVWTDRFDDWTRARSQVVAAVHQTLAEAGIQRL